MYLYCYPDSYRGILNHLQLRVDFNNIQNFQLESRFVLLTYDDAIKVLEEILKNQQLIEDEEERLDIENYESSTSMSQILNRDPFHRQSIDPPREKKENGMWRRQLIDYVHEDGLIYNEWNGKIQRIDTNQPIDNPKPAVDRSFKPELKE